MAFKGVDYFLVDSLFTEQELLVRQTALLRRHLPAQATQERFAALIQLR
jgi:hypothetical protein